MFFYSYVNKNLKSFIHKPNVDNPALKLHNTLAG